MTHKKQLEELSYKQRWLLSEYLCGLLSTKETKADVGNEKYIEISAWINNLIDIWEEVDSSGIIIEKIYQYINKNELLLKVVSCIKTEKYLMLNERYLAGFCKKTS